MCKTCNGTGGINTEHSWGFSFHPCPDSHCDFDREKAWRETQATMERLRAGMREYKTA